MLSRSKGVTLVEIILVIAILGIIAVFALSHFYELDDDALQAAESGTVAAVRSGINNYALESQIRQRSPLYPAQLDSATNGDASQANPVYTEVLEVPMTGSWSKNEVFYTSSTGNVYRYSPSNGSFELTSVVPGFLAMWDMDEGSGSTIGLGAWQTSVNGANWTDGKIGTSLDFDGMNDYATLNVADWSGRFTVSAWVRADTISQSVNTSIFSSSSGTANQSNTFQIDLDGSGNYRFKGGRNDTLIDIAPTTTGWQHIAVTFDGSDVRAYSNGALVGTSAWGGDGLFRHYNIGRNRANGRYFDGSIDEVGVYNRVLSDSEIQSYYESTN